MDNDRGIHEDFDCLHSGVLSSSYFEIGYKAYCTDYDLDMHNLWAEHQNQWADLLRRRNRGV